MHKSATKYNKTLGKWCKNKHGASKIIDTLETYHSATDRRRPQGVATEEQGPSAREPPSGVDP
jgi:hypothetical protein